MKFNAYIVELKHRDNSLSATILDSTQHLQSVNFNKIGKDLFIANFKTQVEFRFLDQIELKGKNKDILVLMPAMSKYNKRKFSKIAKFLEKTEERNLNGILTNLLNIEKFLKVDELLDFFSISREEMLKELIDKEIRREIKIIGLSSLFITSYENFLECQEEMKSIFTNCFTGRIKSIKLVEIEARLKLPLVSLFFKYLINFMHQHFSFKAFKDKIVFQKMGLSDSEKISLEEIEAIVRQTKNNIFTLDTIQSNSDLLQHEINNSLWFLVENGKVTQLDEASFIFTEELNKIINKLKKFKRNQGDWIDIQTFRELTQYSRKYIIILFEYFDAQRITERIENRRKILLSA